jgi:peptide deformylase
MLLDILKFPDPILKRVAQPVDNITGQTVRFINNMVDTMYAAPGVGLAAPQVGLSRRIIVIDTDHKNRGKNLLKLINPVIRAAEGEVVSEEGCLSVTEYTAEVKRAERVEVVGLDANGKDVRIETDGFVAIVLQHEIDHLDGKLFIDRISRLKRELYVRKLKKLARTGKTLEEPERQTIGL